MVDLGLRCSLNVDFKDFSVSPTYIAVPSSHLILYTGPTTFYLLIISLGFTNNCLRTDRTNKPVRSQRKLFILGISVVYCVDYKTDR